MGAGVDSDRHVLMSYPDETSHGSPGFFYPLHAAGKEDEVLLFHSFVKFSFHKFCVLILPSCLWFITGKFHPYIFRTEY